MTSAYVALLRGINLGGRNRVSMAELRALVERLGHTDVSTYLQSGNVVFRSSRRTASELAAEIEREIANALGLRLVVVVRSAPELAEIVDGNPFPGADQAQLHVTFLTTTPKAAAARELAAGRFEPDELRIAGREVYLSCPNGYGRTRLGNEFLERKLGVGATTRNWRSVTALAALAGSFDHPPHGR